MRRVLRGFAMGLLVGGLAGLWFGMNIGKDQPLLSNPFTEVSISDRIERTADDVAEETGKAMDEAVEKAGDAVDNAGNE